MTTLLVPGIAVVVGPRPVLVIHSGASGIRDANGRIDFGDIASFSEYWLQRTDYRGPATDPNKPLPGL